MPTEEEGAGPRQALHNEKKKKQLHREQNKTTDNTVAI
jgi:hypothetical protein